MDIFRHIKNNVCHFQLNVIRFNRIKNLHINFTLLPHAHEKFHLNYSISQKNVHQSKQ